MRRAALVFGLVALTLSPAGADGAGWSKPHTITRSANDGPWLATNDRGDSALVWAGSRTMMAALSRRGGPIGAPRAIPGSDTKQNSIDELSPAMDRRGNLVVAWTEMTD